MAGDWVKLYRSSRDHPVFDDPWIWKLWSWCLFKANFREATWKGQRIEPGQFVTGRHMAADELGVSPSKWMRGIDRLIELGCVTKTANSTWTTLTVCNWRTYQERDEQDRTAGDTTNGQQVIQPADTIEECKEQQECKEGKKKTKPAASPGGVPNDQKFVIPESLDTGQFRQAWGEWLQHRKEKRKSMTPSSARALLKKLDGLGVDRAVSAIYHSIAAGWQGVFEPSAERKNSNGVTAIGAGQVFKPESDSADTGF